MQSCYLAGPGTVDQVTILREGTDGAEMKVVPQNPVVVELVRERYCFVASRDVLFDDREAADLEAERLRLDVIQKRLERRKEIQRMIDSRESNSDTGELQTQQPNLVLVNSVPSEVAILEVDEPQQVIDVEPEFPEGEEDDLNLANPKAVVRNIQRVIGNETLTLDEVHDRMKASGWMPAHSDPISYIKFHLSGNRNLFERPEGSRVWKKVLLAAGNPYRDKPWKPPVVEEKKKSKTAAAKPAKPLKINPRFLTWLGNSMVQTKADKASFLGDTIKLVEQLMGDEWTCEISVAGMLHTGKSKRRDSARHRAEEAMSAAAVKINVWVHRAHHPEET